MRVENLKTGVSCSHENSEEGNHGSSIGRFRPDILKGGLWFLKPFLALYRARVSRAKTGFFFVTKAAKRQRKHKSQAYKAFRI